MKWCTYRMIKILQSIYRTLHSIWTYYDTIKQYNACCSTQKQFASVLGDKETCYETISLHVDKGLYCWINFEAWWIYVTKHIERGQLSQKIKIDFLLFPKWLFFQLNFGAKFFEIGYCVLEIWQCH